MSILKTRIDSLPKTPFAFLGLGIYRAWIEMVYVGPWIDFPVFDYFGQDAFDLAMVATLLSFALASTKITPLFQKRKTLLAAVALMVVSTGLVYITLLAPQIAQIISLPVALMSGTGTAIIILIWSEIYSTLSPFKVALYYAESILACAVIVFICKGFVTEYLCAISMALPALSLACAKKAFSVIPPECLPERKSTRRLFPWKPALLMAVYAFAYGLKEQDLLASTGPMSGIGVVLAAIAVIVGVGTRGRKFNLDIVYRIALPAMICAFAIVPILGFRNATFANACASLSYTAYSIYIMVVLGGISRRFGISAIFLFGLERGMRALFTLIGRSVDTAVDTMNGISGISDVTMTCIVIILIATVAMMLMSERDINSHWGISLESDSDSADKDAHSRCKKRAALKMRCSDIAESYSLTARECEVLNLLADKKSISEIERELFIANGTAKAHVRHIYEKLGIHNREELFRLTGTDEN